MKTIDKENIEKRVKDTIAGIMTHENPQNSDSYNNDLGVDPFDMDDITYALQKEFSLTITDDESSRWNTIQDTIDFIHTQLSNP